MKRPAQACGFCGEHGHNLRTCRVARLPFTEQWAWFIDRERYSKQTFSALTYQGDIPRLQYRRSASS